MGDGDTLIGTVIRDRYRIVRKLGEGGFAETYLAEDGTSGETCVLKRLLFERLEEIKSLEMFRREGQVLRALSHPRIPRFIDAFEGVEDGRANLCIVQAYVEGESLAAQIVAGKRFTEAEGLRLLAEIAEILVYLHGLAPPVFHRDIKPGNIVTGPDGHFHLIDFGAVRDHLKDDARTHGGGSTIVGTFGYMPLEQFEGRVVAASDLYALGATLLHALSGRPPAEFEKRGLALRLDGQVNVSRPTLRLLRKLLDPDFRRRPRTATALRAAVRRLQVPPARSRLIVAGIGVAAAAAVALVAARPTTSSRIALQESPVRARVVCKYARDSETPLHRAAQINDMTTLQRLVESGFDVNATAAEGVTAVRVAAESLNGNAVRYLLDHGAKADPLTLAVLGDTKQLTQLLDAGADIETRGPMCKTPLIMAAMNNSAPVATLLIARGADLEARDQFGKTALSWATNRGHATIGLLLAKGADVNTVDDLNQTPLYYAATVPALAKVLLDAGADVDRGGQQGWSPLIAASRHGTLDSVRLLLARGATVDKVDVHGLRAVHRAAMGRHKAVADALIAAGAEVDVFAAAALGRHAQVTSYLGQGGSPNATVGSQLTLLVVAASGGDARVIKLLIDAGADVNLAGADGLPPLHAAVAPGNRAAVEILVAHKADINRPSSFYDSLTPLDLAEREGHIDLAKFLRERGALPSTAPSRPSRGSPKGMSAKERSVAIENALDLPALHRLIEEGFLENLYELELGERGVWTSASAAAAFKAMLADQTFALNQTLRIRGAWFDDRLARIVAAHRGLAGIQVLNLRETTVTDAGLVEILRSPQMARLWQLGIQDTPVGDRSLATLAAEGTMIHLRDLVIAGGRVTDVGLAALGDSARLRSLSNLNFWKNRLADKTGEILARSPVFRGLKALALQENDLGAPAARSLSEGKFPLLERLDLGQNPLGREGVAALAALRNLPLRELNLVSTGAGDAGVKAILGAPWVHQLRRLYLGANGLGDEAAIALAATDLPALAELSLDQNGITDHGATALSRAKHWPSLSYLGVGGNRFGRGAIAALEKTFAGALAPLAQRP